MTLEQELELARAKASARMRIERERATGAPTKPTAPAQESPGMTDDKTAEALRVGAEEGATFGARPLLSGVGEAIGQGAGVLANTQGLPLSQRLSAAMQAGREGFTEGRSGGLAEQQALQESNPVASTIGNAGGMLLTAPLTTIRGLKGATAGAKAVKGLAEAGKAGAMLGIGRAAGEANSPEEAAKIAATETGLGLAGGAVGIVASKIPGLGVKALSLASGKSEEQIARLPKQLRDGILKAMDEAGANDIAVNLQNKIAASAQGIKKFFGEKLGTARNGIEELVESKSVAKAYEETTLNPLKKQYKEHPSMENADKLENAQKAYDKTFKIQVTEEIPPTPAQQLAREEAAIGNGSGVPSEVPDWAKPQTRTVLKDIPEKMPVSSLLNLGTSLKEGAALSSYDSSKFMGAFGTKNNAAQKQIEVGFGKAFKKVNDNIAEQTSGKTAELAGKYTKAVSAETQLAKDFSSPDKTISTFRNIGRGAESKDPTLGRLLDLEKQVAEVGGESPKLLEDARNLQDYYTFERPNGALKEFGNNALKRTPGALLGGAAGAYAGSKNGDYTGSIVGGTIGGMAGAMATSPQAIKNYAKIYNASRPALGIAGRVAEKVPANILPQSAYRLLVKPEDQ